MIRVAFCVREVIYFAAGRQTKLIAYDKNNFRLWTKCGAEAHRVSATMRRMGIRVVERRVSV